MIYFVLGVVWFGMIGWLVVNAQLALAAFADRDPRAQGVFIGYGLAAVLLLFWALVDYLRLLGI